jgi:hypothetical protein
MTLVVVQLNMVLLQLRMVMAATYIIYWRIRRLTRLSRAIAVDGLNSIPFRIGGSIPWLTYLQSVS